MSREAFITEFNPEPADITICGSMSHKDEWLEVADELRSLGLSVIIPNISEHDSWNNYSEEEVANLKGALVREHLANIAVSKAILVYNGDKGQVKNYIGGNTFLEMGVAFGYGIPTYVYNPLPNMPYRDELIALQPVVIHGDLDMIKVAA